MQYLELSDYVDRHLRQIGEREVLDITLLADELHRKLPPDQRDRVDPDRLRDRILALGADRFPVLKW